MQYFKNVKFLQMIFFILSVLPACVLGILVINYSVNVPVWDQWFVGATLVKAFEGKLTFADLISQHNESRYFFPRLVFIALAYLTHWNIEYEIFVSVLLTCFISYNLYYLNRITVGIGKLQGLFIALLSNLLIFSTMQFESWNSGLMLPNYMSIACIITCLAVAYSKLNFNTKFIISACLSTVSTFSFANGLLCWIVFFPTLAWVSFQTNWFKQKWFIIGWLVGFLTNISIYFYNYIKPAGHPSYLIILERPIQASHSLLIFLGASLGFGDLTASTIVGVVI